MSESDKTHTPNKEETEDKKQAAEMQTKIPKTAASTALPHYNNEEEKTIQVAAPTTIRHNRWNLSQQRQGQVHRLFQSTRLNDAHLWLLDYPGQHQSHCHRDGHG